LNGAETGSALAGSGAALSFDNRKTAGAYTISAMNVTTECTSTMSGTVNIGFKIRGQLT